MHGTDLAKDSFHGEESQNVRTENFSMGDRFAQKIESREPSDDERRSGRLDGTAAKEQEA